MAKVKSQKNKADKGANSGKKGNKADKGGNSGSKGNR
jgi:hypothetical protein